MILRDRDTSADGTLDERRYYCQSWRHDVVAILTSNGQMAEQVRYSAYGVPFGLPLGDVDGDGDVDNDDRNLINGAMNEQVGSAGYDVRADLSLSGEVTTSDLNTWNDHDGDSLGWDALSIGTIVEATSGGEGVGNRKGYAGYEHDHVLASAWSVYHVRHRVYNADLGRWLTRDPLGYVDGMSLYEYVSSRPNIYTDVMGLAGQICMDIVCNHDPFCCECWDSGCDTLASDVCTDNECEMWALGNPKGSNSQVCGQYGNRTYKGVSLKCFCECAGDSAWSQYVRACLACMDEIGVSVDTAHEICYAAGDKYNPGLRPWPTLGRCYAKCRSITANDIIPALPIGPIGPPQFWDNIIVEP